MACVGIPESETDQLSALEHSIGIDECIIN